MGRATVRLDERAYTDGWGMWASTTNARVFVDVGERLLLWPHLRYHVQSAASFWRRAYEVAVLPDGSSALPPYRTGDRELSPLDTVTVGGGLRARLTSAPRAPWFLSFQISGAYTRFSDTLYLTERWSLFSMLALSAQWN